MELGAISFDTLSGMLIAFVLSVAVVGLDIQGAIKTQLGSLANTSVFAVWQGWTVLLGWGLAVSALFLVIINHPTWAQNTFHLNVSNNASVAGGLVGISAVLLIRSKLAKVGNIEVGCEWIYLWTRAYVLNAVNRLRVNARIRGEKLYKSFAKDVAGCPSFFSELENWMLESIKGKPSEIASKITLQIAEIKKQANPSPDGDANTRIYLIGLALDFFSPVELNDWASASGLPSQSGGMFMRRIFS